MAALQKFPQQLSVNTRMGADSYGSCKAAGVEVSDQFPAGMRVLVVDDDTTCLKILEQMLQRCSYCVTTCSQATDALRLLRERKGCFDLVLSDVHMPDMDGYKLLEHVGLEMDLPVIMMSADGTTSAVMKGIRHGACDYLIKPVREEGLKNIWQHVVRKKRNGNKELEHLGSFEDNDRNKRGSDDTEFTSSVNEGSEGMLKAQKKKRDVKEEDDGELESDDPSASKKPRVVWSVELHQQFVTAVNQLGIDKAVPKRILELMNVPGLTRENVASHLQKFRLYLKKLSGIAQQQSGIPDLLLGPTEPNTIQGSSLGRYDIQALVASGKIPLQIYAALNAELLGRSTGSLMLPTMNHPSLVQAPSLQGPKCLSVEQCAPFGHPLMKSQSSTSKQLPQSVMSVEDVSSGFGTWPGTGRDVLPPGSSCSINVQPSCLVVPSQLSSSSFNTGNSPASVNQNSGFSSPFSLPSINIPFSIPSNNSSLSVGQISNKSTGVLSGYLGVDNNASQQSRNSSIMFGGARQTPEVVPGMYNFGGNVVEQGLPRNHGFIGKVTCVPSQFALDELESPTSNLNVGQIYMEIGENRVKQEPNLGFMENARLGIPMSQHYPPNDLTGVFLD